MKPHLVALILICSSSWRAAGAADQTAACPKSSKDVQASCRAITYKDLPTGARLLLRRMKCDVRAGSPYDSGSAVDLNNDGMPEYEFCCHEAPHGPCDAVLIGKVGTKWKDLTAKDGLLGFEGACNLLVVLETQHGGYHDLCLPIQCSQPVRGGNCEPTIWHYDGTRYRSSDASAGKPSGQHEQ